jgi:hypothetical protein
MDLLIASKRCCTFTAVRTRDRRFTMSKYSGDTARHNRVRKQRIRQRANVRALRLEIDARKAEASAAKPKS